MSISNYLDSVARPFVGIGTMDFKTSIREFLLFFMD
jgi:hypothetical protein